METASEIELALGLAPFSTVLTNDANGNRKVLLKASGEEVPIECSLWALRCICSRRGLDSAIETGIASLGVNQQTAARAQWSYAGDKLKRSDVLITQLRNWIGYNNRQMDALFAAALSVEALR